MQQINKIINLFTIKKEKKKGKEAIFYWNNFIYDMKKINDT